jgi:hypothetical protein
MKVGVLARAGIGAVGVVAVVTLSSCETDQVLAVAPNPVTIVSQSTTPVFLKGLPAGVTATALIGSDDVLPGSPNFVFGGSADGAGLWKNPDGSYIALVNNEDHFAVSRIRLDSTFKPIAGDYIINSTAGKYRLCSATLATPAEHGFGPLFITAGESNEESQILAIAPDAAANAVKYLDGLGRWNTENAVPLPKSAYPGKTVMIIGDDDSGPEGGQVVLYVSNTVGDLDNGSIYVLARSNDATRERDMVVGQTYPVVFKPIPGHKTMTGRQLNQAAATLRAMPFGRVEDLDYRKDGIGREIYFNVTGQNNTGNNADYSRSKYGRVYRLRLDATNMLAGTLEVILDGDDRSGPARTFQNPDNILVTRNYVYVQEDPNSYGDETHDAYIYQYNIATRAVTVVMEIDHRRNASDGSGTRYGGTGSAFGTWEYGAMIDISDIVRKEDTFMLSVQPHAWRGTKYAGVTGGTLQTTENQASQVVIVRGLPR